MINVHVKNEPCARTYGRQQKSQNQPVSKNSKNNYENNDGTDNKSDNDNTNHADEINKTHLKLFVFTFFCLRTMCV